MNIQSIKLHSPKISLQSPPSDAQRNASAVIENPYINALNTSTPQDNQTAANTRVIDTKPKKRKLSKREDRKKTLFEKLALPIIILFCTGLLVIRMLAAKGRKAVALALEPAIKESMEKNCISDDYWVRASREYLEPPLSPKTLPLYLKAGWIFLVADFKGENISKLYYSLVKKFAKEITIEELTRKAFGQTISTKDFEAHMFKVLNNPL